jgi:hypothetical protein
MSPLEEKYSNVQFDFEMEPIEAYASATSVKQGETIDFHVRTNESINFTVDFILKGLDDIIKFSGIGSAVPSDTNVNPWINGCGWPVCYTLSIPEDWQSGAYIAKFYSGETAFTEVLFFVRPLNPGIATKILFQSSVNTAQAYNNWGGKSLYDYNSSVNKRSYKVSFNRPMFPGDFYRWELPFIKWLENEGYPVEFCTNTDLHADTDLFNNYKLFLSVGHDEYWSWEMRDRIDYFSDLNGNVAFFSGNTCWWQVRLEPQDDGLGEVPNRLLVCYKEQRNPDNTFSPGLDPYLTDQNVDKRKTSCNWYDVLTDRPENLMTGVSFYNGVYHDPITMPIAFYKTKLNKHWLLKNTNLKYGGLFGVYDNYKTIGYETDAAEYIDSDKKFPIPTGKLPVDIQGKYAPKDFMILASSNLTDWADDGQGSSGYNNHNGWVTMGIFRKSIALSEGGYIFTVGTTDWSNGLLYVVENQNNQLNEVHHITKNVLDTLGGSTFQIQQFLLDNPNFENWSEVTPDVWYPDGWYKEGAGNIYKSSPGHNGQFCMRVDATNGQTWISQNYISVRTNRQYRVQCWAKGSHPSNNAISNITIRLQSTDGYVDFAIANYAGLTDWRKISAEGMLNNSETILQPVRVKIQVSAGIIAYFDEVVVEEL